MKYNTKIIPEGNGQYTGQLLKEGQVIYTTSLLSDPVIVSRELASQIARLSEPIAIAPKIAPSPVIAPSVPYTQRSPSSPSSGNILRYRQTPPARKCCGRG